MENLVVQMPREIRRWSCDRITCRVRLGELLQYNNRKAASIGCPRALRILAKGRAMRTLTPAEASWLQSYQMLLEREFPGRIEEISIFGSKARGDAKSDSDLDVLVVIREGNWDFKEALTRPGYDLAIGTDVVPSLHVYTIAEWAQLLKQASVFREAVERDRVTVA